MEIIKIETSLRTYELHIESNKIIKWYNIVEGEKVPMKFVMKSEGHKVYEDKKGKFIKINHELGTYKHYIK
ncbi:hypothetical protein BC351_00490 [Paenibacillus ferrarius]|uniref:Uncharacterized protein n=1 Tax=Paenibacillus ferrarius TaxID=1469647 RepID=A0A1V4HS36_9BACL|nr:hypothetical protein [Paenibacillus ferrarius]OPH61754.1 hypothetical protein BC351_00490 [Paenibacillus ferrarius]